MKGSSHNATRLHRAISQKRIDESRRRSKSSRSGGEVVQICESYGELKLLVELLRIKNRLLHKAGQDLYGIAYAAGPAEGRVKKLDAWRKAKRKATK